MRTLVTGGAGFIGAALVERLLAEGHTVDVVDNLSTGSLWNLADARAGAGRDLTFHQLDVRSPDVPDLIVRRRPEVVWHLAAQTDVAAGIATPATDAHINVLGTLGLLEGVRAAESRKLVVASSAAVYGELEGKGAATESHPRRPLSPHGVAKHAIDAYLATFAELESLVFTSLVLGSVYGPRSSAGVVKSWADCLVAGRPCTLFGEVDQVRDFVYVDDVVDALARAGDRGDGMVLNVATGEGTALGDLHTLMVETAGRMVAELDVAHQDPGHLGQQDHGEPKDEPRSDPQAWAHDDQGVGEPSVAEAALRRGPALGMRHAPARKGEPRHAVLDPSRAAKVLDWCPWTSLAEGVETVLRTAIRPSSR